MNVVEILQKLIQFPSVTPEDCGAQDYLISLLKPMGFEIYDLPFEGRGSYPVKNFFARRGTEGPHLCFGGHTDVVPAGDEKAWSVPPFSGQIVDGKIIGRGTSDMKGEVAAFIAAVSKFDSTKGSISLLITGDEEADAVNGTVRVLEWMKDNNHIPDVALVGEPSSPQFMGQSMRIGRRGSLSAVLTARGTQGHVANPHLADNPLPRLVKFLDAIAGLKLDNGLEYFPASNLEITSIDVGNKAGNVIPSHGVAKFNVRFNTTWTHETLEKKILDTLNGVGNNYEIVFNRSSQPFLTKPGEWTSLVRSAVTHIMGKEPELNAGGGTSDARFIAKYCPVVESGMTSKTIHHVDEYCTLEDLEKCELIYLEILKRYFA